MRALFVSLFEKSHLYCMAPLAWALTTAGHEVRVASAPSLVPTITGAGLTAVPVGSDNQIHEEMAQNRESQNSKAASWSHSAPDEVTWEEIRYRYQLSVPYGFALYNDCMIEDLAAFAQGWQPDLVVRDPLAYAGAIAARVSGAAHVRLLWCADVWGLARSTFLQLREQAPPEERTVDPLAEWLSARAEPYGFACDEEMVNGQATVDCLPPSLRLPTGLDVLSARYVPHNGPAVVWDWLREAPKRPRVCLTLGSSNTEDYGGDYVSVPEILGALADLDIEVVAALVPAQREDIGAVPENVRVVDSVALNTLLPSCSAVIHHGGYGSYSTALVHGVPQLVLSTFVSDHELRGRMLERAGAGFFVHHSEVQPEQVRTLVRRMVEEPAFAEAAERLRAESAAMPAPNDLVPALERMAERRRSERAPDPIV